MRSMAKQISPGVLKEESAIICRILESSPEFQSARSVLLYYAQPGEVDTRFLIQAWSKHKSIFLPVVQDAQQMTLRKYTDEKKMQFNQWGIAEPCGEDYDAYEHIDLAVIPGLAFDKKAYRLGRGKGYYDRFLNQLKCPVFGLCFAFQYIDKLPVEAWDFQVQRVISSL